MTTEDRVELLEKQLAQTKKLVNYLTLFILVLVGIGSIGAMTVESNKEVHANKFILEDENGNGKSVWSVVDGMPCLMFGDGKEPRIIIGQVGDSKDTNKFGLWLYHENSVPAITLSTANNNPIFALKDKSGGNIALLASLPLKGTTFDLFDINGKLTTQINSFVGGPEISLSDELGNPRVAMGFSSKPYLALMNENKKVYWAANDGN